MSRLLSEGEHAGYRWEVHAAAGHRCGYVFVHPGHPWYMRSPDRIEAPLVHNGITAGDLITGKGYRVGFDCAGDGDAPDPALAPVAKRELDRLLKAGRVIRNQKYVEEQCLLLCALARAATTGAP